MTIEAHVGEGLRVVGEWTHQGTGGGAVNMPANSWHDIGSVAFRALKDHYYLIDVTATGFMYGNTPERVKYKVSVDGPNVVVAEQQAGFNSGQWSALIAIPIMLTSIYRCNADIDATAVFRHHKQSASADWVLDDGFHRMTVYDLGVGS